MKIESYRFGRGFVKSSSNHLQPLLSTLLALCLHHHRRSSQIHHFLQTNHVHVGSRNASNRSQQPVTDVLINSFSIHIPSTHPQLQVTDSIVLILTTRQFKDLLPTPPSSSHQYAVCKYSSQSTLLTNELHKSTLDPTDPPFLSSSTYERHSLGSSIGFSGGGMILLY